MYIQTQEKLSTLAKNMKLPYHWLWECVRFKRNGIKAIMIRNKLLSLYKSTVINDYE